MKKNILAVLIASSIGLYGCGNESEVTGNPTIDPIIEKSLKAETKILFDLASKTLVLPTFLAMDSTDGTLATELSAKDPTDWTDPKVAMGKTDGWSTTQPIVIEFIGNDLEPSANAAGFYLIESNDPTATNQTKTPALLSDDYFQVMTSGKKLTVILKKPLNPASNYMFAITDELKDVKGNSVGMTGSYATLKATVKPPLDDLIPVQTITHAIEKELDTAGVNADSIIFSSWFTTHSVGSTLYATKAAIATGLGDGSIGTIWEGTAANPNNVDLSPAYTIYQTKTEDYAAALTADTNFTKYLEDDGTQKAALSAAYTQKLQDANDAQDLIDPALPDITSLVEVTKGIVKLPYYLEKGADNWSSTPFQSAMPSLAKISIILANPESDDAKAIGLQLVTAGIDVTQLATNPAEQLKLVGLTLTDASGKQLDAERLITKYSPVPQIKSLEDVDFLLFTPTGAVDSSTPVVIYQHGITSAKENSYAFATNLAASGIAVIAIDNPLHGERSLDDQRSANADIKAYLNLGNLPVARDSIRQSMLDIIGLRAALSVTSGHSVLRLQEGIKALNPTDTSFLGHSLGGVVGAPAVVAANRTINDTAGDALFNFTKSAFANSGGDIGNLLFNSDSFGSLIKHNLMLSESKDYQQYYSTSCTVQNVPGWENTCFDNFYAFAPATAQTEMDSTFASFTYAAQTIIGTADPVNAAMLAATNKDLNGNSDPILATHPMYMLQVSGDDTVPNDVLPTAPLAGTKPMAALFGLTSLKSDSSGIKHFAKFNEGASGIHTTFIAPKGVAEYAAHGEMQRQLIQFLLSGGTIAEKDGSFSLLED